MTRITNMYVDSLFERKIALEILWVRALFLKPVDLTIYNTSPPPPSPHKKHAPVYLSLKHCEKFII